MVIVGFKLKIPGRFFMMKFVLRVVALFAVGGMGFVSAQDAQPVAGSHPMSVNKVAHLRIVKLKDRILSQREQIRKDLKANSLTTDQAQACREVLNKVEDQMKTEHKANGSKKTMSKDQYAAYNSSLDANSAAINEEKQYYYYYGPYADYGPYYNYYYDAYPAAGAPTPSVTAMGEEHPRIFELKQRIQSQRERIDQGLTANSLTGDEAKGCRDVLASVENQMKTDYKANGSKTMTREQYAGYNATLDTNSAVIHEEKQYFYYYGPYYDQYRYWD
jgi:hypothetical protein